MIDASNVRDWLNALSLIYWALAVIGVVIAWKLASGRVAKIVSAVVVFGFFAYWPVSEIVETSMKRAEFDKRYAAAAARFEDRCKIAGDKIVRTVDDVDGIFVLKMRMSKDKGYGVEQMAPSAAFYHESTEGQYLDLFLWFEDDDRIQGSRGRLNIKRTASPGYQHVDYVDPTDGKRYRYRLVARPDANSPGGSRYVTERSVALEPMPRYGVTFDDLVDPLDRDHWIAGSVVKIIDLQDNQEIARHVRFAFDRGLGDRGAHRTPWASPEYCPSFRQTGAIKTRHFVDQVLIPKK